MEQHLLILFHSVPKQTMYHQEGLVMAQILGNSSHLQHLAHQTNKFTNMISSLKCVAICCIIISVNITRLFATPKTHLKIHDKHYINIPEPSDVCLSANKNSIYIVSDQGHLYQTDLQGKVLKQSNLTGDDFEAVYADESFIYP